MLNIQLATGKGTKYMKDKMCYLDSSGAILKKPFHERNPLEGDVKI